MGMHRKFRVVAGTVMERGEFEDRFDDTYEFEKMDNDILAFDGFEAQHDEVVVGNILATFSRLGDLEAMHSQDLRSEFEDVAPEVKRQLQDLGIERSISIYTVSEYR